MAIPTGSGSLRIPLVGSRGSGRLEEPEHIGALHGARFSLQAALNWTARLPESAAAAATQSFTCRPYRSASFGLAQLRLIGIGEITWVLTATRSITSRRATRSQHGRRTTRNTSLPLGMRPVSAAAPTVAAMCRHRYLPPGPEGPAACRWHVGLLDREPSSVFSLAM